MENQQYLFLLHSSPQPLCILDSTVLSFPAHSNAHQWKLSSCGITSISTSSWRQDSFPPTMHTTWGAHAHTTFKCLILHSLSHRFSFSHIQDHPSKLYLKLSQRRFSLVESLRYAKGTSRTNISQLFPWSPVYTATYTFFSPSYLPVPNNVPNQSLWNILFSLARSWRVTLTHLSHGLGEASGVRPCRYRLLPEDNPYWF